MSTRPTRIEDPGNSAAARKPVVAAVALGSNLGDRRAVLDAAVRDVAGLPNVRVLAVSEWFETEPVGGPAGQGPFLNGALVVRTTLTAPEFLAQLQGIEARHGRDRSDGVRNGPRTLDLDLLVHGDERHASAGLTVPHPRLGERAFVLEPLASIAPDLWVPTPAAAGAASSSTARGATVRDLWSALTSATPTSHPASHRSRSAAR